MANETTGQTVSRLGVLTVLTYNLLPENHIGELARKENRREITAILNGMRDVDPAKVQGRSLERCVNGMWN